MVEVVVVSSLKVLEGCAIKMERLGISTSQDLGC